MPVSLIDGPEAPPRARKYSVGSVCRGFAVIEITNATNFDTLHKQAADLGFLTDRFNRCAKLIEVIRTAAGILKLIKTNSAP